MARGPAEVLVAVGVEFCRVCQSLSIGVRFVTEKHRGKSLSPQRASYICRTGIASWCVGLVAQEFEVVGWGGIMYRSISGGPGQGPGLVNWLMTGMSLA
jgi:hypothetical protein